MSILSYFTNTSSIQSSIHMIFFSFFSNELYIEAGESILAINYNRLKHYKKSLRVEHLTRA